MTRRTPTSKLPEIEFPVLDEMSDGEEVSDGLEAIAPRTGLNKHEMIIGRDHYLLLKKMEDYAQDLAELVVRYFKEKDLDVRKDLILKSVEVLKLNPHGWRCSLPNLPLLFPKASSGTLFRRFRQAQRSACLGVFQWMHKNKVTCAQDAPLRRHTSRYKAVPFRAVFHYFP